MKKTYAILVAVIFLISVSAVFAADSSKEIFLGGVKFSVPSNGEFNPDNTGYHTDKFGIDLIQDNSLHDEQNTIKNSSLTKMTLYHRDVLAIYSKSSDDFNVPSGFMERGYLSFVKDTDGPTKTPSSNVTP